MPVLAILKGYRLENLLRDWTRIGFTGSTQEGIGWINKRT